MKRLLQILALGLLFYGCKRPFESPVSQLSKDVLCIEGFINTGGEASIITLTKLQDLKDTTSILPELKAKIFIQEENGPSVPLTEEGKGKYTLEPKTYDVAKRYRLTITRNNGRQYQSEFVKVITTPPIDKLDYKLDSNGVFIVLDTHDKIDAQRYYYWQYEETWYFSVPQPSQYYLKDKKFIKRTQSVEYCYRTEKSNKIILGTTANLSDNLVKEQEIQFADHNTGRLSIIYSINVSQHAIDKEYFEYLQKMKKNTETIGSIFDAQPTQNTSNIHAVANSDEMVVGHFNMHSVQQKRMFIKANDLPSFSYTKAMDCVIQDYKFWDGKTTLFYQYPEEYFVDPNKLVPLVYYERLPYASTVTGVPGECGDCTLRGVLTKPSFWPY